ncbi:hypothetical protein ACFLZ9_00390 [Patescibacteria group bacterium]
MEQTKDRKKELEKKLMHLQAIDDLIEISFVLLEGHIKGDVAEDHKDKSEDLEKKYLTIRQRFLFFFKICFIEAISKLYSEEEMVDLINYLSQEEVLQLYKKMIELLDTFKDENSLISKENAEKYHDIFLSELTMGKIASIALGQEVRNEPSGIMQKLLQIFRNPGEHFMQIIHDKVKEYPAEYVMGDDKDLN